MISRLSCGGTRELSASTWREKGFRKCEFEPTGVYFSKECVMTGDEKLLIRCARCMLKRNRSLSSMSTLSLWATNKKTQEPRHIITHQVSTTASTKLLFTARTLTAKHLNTRNTFFSHHTSARPYCVNHVRA